MHHLMEISSLSDEDYVRIVAHYHTMAGEAKSVDSNLVSRGYTPEQLEIVNRQFIKTFRSTVIGGLRFTKPYAHLKYPSMNYVLVLLENYEHGCLPFPGSVSEQPAQMIEILSTLKFVRREIEAKASEKQK